MDSLLKELVQQWGPPKPERDIATSDSLKCVVNLEGNDYMKFRETSVHDFSSEKIAVEENGVDDNGTAIDTSIRNRTNPHHKMVISSGELLDHSTKIPFEQDCDLLTRELRMPDGIEKEVVNFTSPIESVSSSSQTSASAYYQEYGFHYTSSHTHIIITDAEQKALFFSEVSAFSKGVPDVQLRNIAEAPENLSQRGDNIKPKDAATAKVIAVADFLSSSDHIRLGFGYLDIPESVSWAVMKCIESADDLETYEMTLSADACPDRKYHWLQARKNSTKTNFATSNQKLLYTMQGSSGIIASLHSVGAISWKKRGILRIYNVPEAEDLQLAIFLSFAALSEKIRRRTWRKNLSLRRTPSKRF